MTPTPNDLTDEELDRLREKRLGDCNRYLNGICTLRKCLIDGGWEPAQGGVDYDQADCDDLKTARALLELQRRREQDRATQPKDTGE